MISFFGRKNRITLSSGLKSPAVEELNELDLSKMFHKTELKNETNRRASEKASTNALERGESECDTRLVFRIEALLLRECLIEGLLVFVILAPIIFKLN